MKKIFLLFGLLFSLNTINAQNTWQETTRIADSLQLQFKFKEVIKYRDSAIIKAKITQKDTLTFLNLLKKISLDELNIKNKKLRKISYTNLQTEINKLENLGAKPERLYQSYRRLYIFSHNYMRNMNDTEKYIKNIN